MRGDFNSARYRKPLGPSRGVLKIVERERVQERGRADDRAIRSAVKGDRE
jgi:hypothetical protein